MSQILERVLEKTNTATKIATSKAIYGLTNVTKDVVVGIDKEIQSSN